MKIIFRKGIGEITLKKSARSKRFSIVVKPFEGVIVTVPEKASFDDAEKIVDTRLEWIEKSLEKIERIEEKRTIFDENTLFSTRNHRLKIYSAQRNDVKIFIRNGLILIERPENRNIREEYIQLAIRKGITAAYRIEAKQLIPKRLAHWAEQFSLKYNKLTIKDITSRWGSCSHTNNINISLYVMQLPDYLIDYILLHELAHTIVKNHGDNFWKVLNQFTNGKAYLLDKEINKYSTKIF